MSERKRHDFRGWEFRPIPALSCGAERIAAERAPLTDLESILAQLESAGLRRRTRVVGSPQGPRVLLDGKPVLLLCSNNYLGLADHPAVRRAAADASLHWGASAGASRLISGTMPAHEELERDIAAFEETEAALLFGSGYLANLGVISALAPKGAIVLSDELNHASIIDGCRLAGAETFIYRHGDAEHLEWGLQAAGDRACLIATDGVFSMDGDVAPLAEIAELAERHSCRLLVDEAHGTGCIGPSGRGAAADAGVADRVDVLVGTLGKALGGYGAYVCCSAGIREYLLNTARPFIFSTALPPGVLAAAAAALNLIRESPRRVEQLAENARVLRDALAAEGLDAAGSASQIVPVVVGDAGDALALCELALERGVFAQAIRPPTVPDGTSRLRLTAMATHSHDELRGAAAVIGRAARELGVAGLAPAREPAEIGVPPGDRLPRAA